MSTNQTRMSQNKPNMLIPLNLSPKKSKKVKGLQVQKISREKTEIQIGDIWSFGNGFRIFLSDPKATEVGILIIDFCPNDWIYAGDKKITAWSGLCVFCNKQEYIGTKLTLWSDEFINGIKICSL